MGHRSSMSGLNKPQSPEETKLAIKAAISGITADINDGIISESMAFDILLSELSTITGLPVDGGNYSVRYGSKA